ncbi:MAG: acyloxyacyl hydrolase [Candidatus Omnitrophica bacterium]|nr:acyloxyacyl hydrolase [Candidatus Omnitrophota bacterium]
MKRIILIITTILCFLFLTLNTRAAEKQQEKSVEAIELLSGFSSGELRKKEDYQLIPVIFDLDFNLKPLTRRLNFDSAQLFQFQIEPFISGVFSPNNNFEAGTAFALKIGVLPEDRRFQPYLKAGAGFVFMSQHTLEQATQFNFIEYSGVGLHYFLFKNTALTFEYRLRHLSNAGIKEPNAGLNTDMFLGGVCCKF